VNVNAIQQILNSFSRLSLHSENEAATRLKVVDRVLKEVLGWTDQDISPETHVSEDGKHTFADYLLRTANVGIVVETKKVGATFDMPLGVNRKERLTSQFVSGALGDAVIQARDYCRGLGVDFAVVTNGNAWIVFPAQRHDQVTFKDSYAIVFPTLTSVLKDDHQEFRELLSRDSAINGSLEVALIGRKENQLSNRTLGELRGASGETTRTNPVYPLIQPGIEVAFSESISELDGGLFEKSYVSTPERTKFDQRIGMHLARKATLFDVQPPRPLKSQDQNVLIDRISSALNRSKPLAVLVLGPVGTGKTTFLQYTRKVKAADYFAAKTGAPYPHWIYVEFRTFTSKESVREYIFSRLFEYLKVDTYFSRFKECIEPAYRNEIESLRRGPLFLLAKDSEKFDVLVTDLIRREYDAVIPYVERLIRSAAKNAPIFLVVDNIDQIETEKLESEWFRDVLAVGQSLGVNIVMSMRESTYAKYRSAPVFDAYDFDPIQIDTPKISSVLSKRFQLAKFLLAGKSGTFTAENGARVTVEDASLFVDLVQSSVLGTEVGHMIEVLATDDVRLALRMTRQFLETGYTNPGRALESFRKQRTYVLPVHEAFRAILQGGSSLYRESTSTIGNPLDAKVGRTEAQLLRLYILSVLVNSASLPGFRQLDVQDILVKLRDIGFGDDLTMRVLKDLCHWRFAFNVSHTEVTAQSSVIPSRLGGYVVRELLQSFVFLEAMMMDTFIPNDQVWNQMRTLTTDIDRERDRYKRIGLRSKRVRLFFDLLDEMFQALANAASKRNLTIEWRKNPFDTALLTIELNRVDESARRNYPSKKL
jgi:GTPase SAR1 family protein